MAHWVCPLQMLPHGHSLAPSFLWALQTPKYRRPHSKPACLTCTEHCFSASSRCPVALIVPHRAQSPQQRRALIQGMSSGSEGSEITRSSSDFNSCFFFFFFFWYLQGPNPLVPRHPSSVSGGAGRKSLLAVCEPLVSWVSLHWTWQHF